MSGLGNQEVLVVTSCWLNIVDQTFKLQLLSFLDNLQSTLRSSGFNEASVAEVMQAMQVCSLAISTAQRNGFCNRFEWTGHWFNDIFRVADEDAAVSNLMMCQCFSWLKNLSFIVWKEWLRSSTGRPRANRYSVWEHVTGSSSIYGDSWYSNPAVAHEKSKTTQQGGSDGECLYSFSQFFLTSL